MKLLNVLNFRTLSLFVIVLLQISCSSDDDKAENIQLPEIQSLEVGVNNNQIAYIGSDLHIEAEVFAENLIQTITVKISNQDNSWSLEKVYEEFAGQRNTLFHKHIDIDSEIPAGTYKFLFNVTDQLGNEVEQEMNLELKLIEDEIPPNLNITNFPQNGTVFSLNQTIQIAGNASDNNSLSSILIALVKSENEIPNEEVTENHENVIVIKNILDLQGNDFYGFNAQIEVGTSHDNAQNPKPIEWQNSNYYILVIAQDLNGNKTFSNHYNFQVNL